ncbi:MAG: metal-dependent transcriptional regulator [Taibaiella sp.]|nr:metal-dependent transcriptional regulator [Taibaiella sp.]
MPSVQTFSEENYLKAIYKLGRRPGEKISPTAIAEELSNNPASVVDMIKKLADKKLISYEKSKGVKLTDKGKKAALLIVRKHRLWEVFLLEKLAYTWDEIHEIAEQLEHIHHPDLADRLDKFLGFPQFDPHGDPIPKSNGDMPALAGITLEDMAVGCSGQVVGVRDTSSPFLQYLRQLNVGIGTQITITEKIVYDGSLVIKVGVAAGTTVSKKFAENVLVMV